VAMIPVQVNPLKELLEDIKSTFWENVSSFALEKSESKL